MHTTSLTDVKCSVIRGIGLVQVTKSKYELIVRVGFSFVPGFGQAAPCMGDNVVHKANSETEVIKWDRPRWENSFFQRRIILQIFSRISTIPMLI